MKSGFAVLTGRSNVGKSTLLNALIGMKVAAMSPKPQTTRHIIHAVLNDPRGQAVFVDTPGIFEAPGEITRKLNEKAESALKDIDLILHVADPTRAQGNEERRALRLIEPQKTKKILVINKTDERNLPYLEECRAMRNKFDGTAEVSALRGQNLAELKNLIFELLPEGEPAYSPEEFTNIEEKHWIAEIIQEKVFIQLHREVPYSIGVEVLEIDERKDKQNREILYIRANILTDDERYKGMIVGSGGQKIKEIGQSARRELELALNRRIFLELRAEADPHWPERLI